MQQSKTDGIGFLQKQRVVTIHLNPDQCLWAHVASTNIFQKAVTCEYVRGFLTVFSHKILHLLFKNLATSIFLIQINTVH